MALEGRRSWLRQTWERSPRGLGLVLGSVGLLATWVQIFLLRRMGQFFPVTFALFALMATLGFTFAVLGRPAPEMPAPFWYRASFGTVALVTVVFVAAAIIRPKRVLFGW